MMEELVRKISSGKAILFVGAGFSKNAKNINGDKELPLAKNLANDIGVLGGFDGDSDLKFASDYFIHEISKLKPELIEELITYLKKVFTIQEANDEHKTLMKIPWRRIYTTNYDDLVEISARSNGDLIETVDIDSSTEIYSGKKVCVHLNGSISMLDDKTLNTKFKLSRSSYMSPDAFTKSSWDFIFKNDLELSSAIVFVGYSLYDIEIEKILFDNPSFKGKVYFIQRSRETEHVKEDYIFQKYGQLLRIGVDGFAKLIEDNIDKVVSAKEEFFLESFVKYEISSTPKETISEACIESFLKHGELKNEYLEQGMTSEKTVPFLIKRAQLDRLRNLISENKIVCVTSELGNGKSVFLRESALLLTLEGHAVYIISDISGNYISDIDKIISSGQSCILIIDTYSNYKDLIPYLISVNLKNIKVLLSERTSNHYSLIREHEKKLKTTDLNIDILEDNEINSLINILEHTSLWGKYGKLTLRQKEEHVKDKCRSQLSSVLIDVLKSTQVKNKISELLSKVFVDEKQKMNIFVICMLDVMNIPISLSLISDIAGNDLALSDFSNSNEIRHFFTLNLYEQSVDTKSSIYSLHLLNEHFDSNYIIEKSLFILKNLDQKFKEIRALDSIRNDIRTNLFRFNFIERMLPLKTKTGMLVKYFETIKNELPFHTQNPQYWLQYGMAHIAMKDYDKASRYLQTAYDKANYRDYYDVHKINNQKARLSLKIASLASTEIAQAMKLFTEADNLLGQHDNDVYKFKVVLDYKKFFESKRNTLSKANYTIIENAVKNKLKDLDALEQYDVNNFKQQKVYRDCRFQLEYMIQMIRKHRGQA